MVIGIRWALVAALMILQLPELTTAAPATDEITSLPGWDGPLPSKQYSGYVDASKTKHLHYWFVEATTNPSTAPLVLWLNGGPGCSSLDGFLYEHGPFRINDTAPTQLVPFDFSWSTAANMLYLESPVGVGFSYSDDPLGNDYHCTDDTAAQDNLHALEDFFQKFPELMNNGLYITGESYAGVYVPTLAEAILWAVGNGTYSGAKLLGIAVGNGCSGNEVGVCGGQREQYDTEYLLGTAFVSSDLKAEIRATCDWSRGPSSKCLELVTEMHDQVGHVDLYNVYGPCISGSQQQLAGSGAGVYKAPLGPTGDEKLHLGGPDACIDSILGSEYMSRREVYEAIHVKAPRIPGWQWRTCGSAPGWRYQSTRPNLPRDTYPFLAQHIRVVIYNGDWDACVPYTDNDAWTRSLNYPVVSEFHPWMYSLEFEGTTTQQVGGYSRVYAPPGSPHNFTFITIRGGRHEVPETAPDKALAMLNNLIHGIEF